jgi:undecaprenyl-diphosphatase
MHWPTDVAASVVFTLVWLLLLRAVLLPPDVRDRPRGVSPESNPGYLQG